MSYKKRSMQHMMKDPTTRVYLPEVLEELNKLVGSKSKEDNQNAYFLAQAYIKKNAEHAGLMRKWLEALYHPAVKFELPDAIPPYDNSQYNDYTFAPTTLNQALAKVVYFVKSTPSYVANTLQREALFIQTLEGMYAKDAKLFEAILLKKFPSDVYPSLGIEFFYKVYPNFFTGIPVDEIAKQEKASETESAQTKKPPAKKTTTTKRKTPAKSVAKESTESVDGGEESQDG